MLFTFIETVLTFESLKTDDSSRGNFNEIHFRNNNINISNEQFQRISDIVFELYMHTYLSFCFVGFFSLCVSECVYYILFYCSPNSVYNRK